ncbi:MAG: hypothetical protein ABI411_21225, partial [Tahibacter sp.]
MVTHSARTLSSALVVCALFGAAAHAQSVNDHWSGRRLIASLPYSFNETTVEGSTVDATDPPAPCRTPSQNATGATLWYGYTSGSTTEYLTVETGNLSFFGNVAVYTGTPGAFRAVSGGC